MSMITRLLDHLDPRWVEDPYPIWNELRQKCPIAHTDRFGGGWLPTRYEDVAAIAYDTERFSSRSIIMGNFRPPRDIAPIGAICDLADRHGAHRVLIVGALLLATGTALDQRAATGDLDATDATAHSTALPHVKASFTMNSTGSDGSCGPETAVAAGRYPRAGAPARAARCIRS